MSKKDIIAGNRRFFIDKLKMLEVLPGNRIYDMLVRQLMRDSVSVEPEYLAACKARTTADFIDKLKIVEEEIADDSYYFLDLPFANEKGKDWERLQARMDESNMMVSIYVASIGAVKSSTGNRTR